MWTCQEQLQLHTCSRAGACGHAHGFSQAPSLAAAACSACGGSAGPLRWLERLPEFPHGLSVWIPSPPAAGTVPAQQLQRWSCDSLWLASVGCLRCMSWGMAFCVSPFCKLQGGLLHTQMPQLGSEAWKSEDTACSTRCLHRPPLCQLRGGCLHTQGPGSGWQDRHRQDNHARGVLHAEACSTSASLSFQQKCLRWQVRDHRGGLGRSKVKTWEVGVCNEDADPGSVQSNTWGMRGVPVPWPVYPAGPGTCLKPRP